MAGVKPLAAPIPLRGQRGGGLHRGKRKKTGTGQKKRVKRRSKPKELNPQAQFWRNMALTQKKKLHIRIPQRQFMGESEELNRRIREKVDQEITNILNQ